MTRALDPTRICYDDMLLSEFVGNHSAYYYGYANPVQSDVWIVHSPVHHAWVRLGQTLMIIRGILAEDNELPSTVFSISYGWIHPKLSAKIVKWKDPLETSYHRWDDGAACDINFHHTTYGPHYFAGDLDAEGEPWQRLSPLGLATLINNATELPHLDRTITYSESPYICIGVSAQDAQGRKKWYENRFEGRVGEKPRFITHSNGQRIMLTDYRPSPMTVDWRGSGHPTYHGFGKLQYQHVRTSLYTVMSDWLYDRDKVHFGHANRMPTSMTRYEYVKNMMHYAGRAYDVLQALAANHLPIIEGIVMGRSTSNWEENGQWSFTIGCPPGMYEDHHNLYQAIQDRVVPQQGDMLRITGVEQLPDRPYLSIAGRALTAQQTRLKITGEYDGPVEQPPNRFDFTTAATSPAFREEAAGGGNDSVPDTRGVPDSPPRTQRRRTRPDRRRGVRTQVFRGRDRD